MLPACCARCPGALGLLERPLPLLWTVAGAAVGAGGRLAAARGRCRLAAHPAAACALVGGVLALWLAWLAVAQARVIGINFLLSVLVLVWVADIFAYFAGPRLRPEVHQEQTGPAISPGKSWEGVWGGMAGVLVLALVWTAGRRAACRRRCPASTRGWPRAGWWLLLIAAVFLAAMSVVGDLVESLIKRSAGVKDSSNLLPGHGGVLDRVDALLPTLPLAMMLATPDAIDETAHHGAGLHRLGRRQHAGRDRPPSRPLRGVRAQRRDPGRPDAAAVRAVQAARSR